MTQRIALFFILLAHAGFSLAQTPEHSGVRSVPASGEIRGVVQDLAHQPVPGATVCVRRSQGYAEYTAVSGYDGSFAIAKLSAGTYRVRAVKKGFPKSPLATFELSAAQSFEVDLTLGATSLHSGFFTRLAHAYVTDWRGAQR